MPPRARVRGTTSVLPRAHVELDSDAAAELLAEQIVADQIARVRETPYATFCRETLGLVLTPGQAAIARTLFDGEAPREEWRDLFGGLDRAPDAFALRTAVAVLGRGSGKSATLLAARAIHLALRVDLQSISVNSPASLIAIVAPDQRQSALTLGFVRSYIESRPILKKLLKAECLRELVRLVRPDGRHVTIEARPAAKGGSAVRGPVLIAVLLEESAFFEGEGYEVNDEEIFRAARPRLIPDGQIIFASSPWAQSGKLWELFRDNYGKPDSAIVCKGPTLRIRPSEDTRRAYEVEVKNDPDNARREYDAEFLSADSERFFPEAVIERCLVPTLELPTPIRHGDRTRFGGDFGFVRDSAALVGFVEGERLSMCVLQEERPRKDLPLVPSEVVAGFAATMRAYGCRLLIADDHYREAIQEHLSNSGVAMASIGNTPAHDYILTRTLMAQGRVAFPPHARLLAQLRKVRATTKPGGVTTIHQPRSKDGGHGDLVSAMVCALSGASIESTLPAPSPVNKKEALTLMAKKEQAQRLGLNEKRQEKQARGMLRQLTPKWRAARALTR